MRALLRKNYLKIVRNRGLMCFIFALPVVQTVLFCLAIGRDPTGLSMAIVNDEVKGPCSFKNGCNFTQLSCRYLSYLGSNIEMESYNDLDTAKQAARDGKAWGVILFNQKFSTALMESMTAGAITEEAVIHVWLDMSDMQIGTSLHRRILKAFNEFSSVLLTDCDKDPKSVDIPIQFMDPIYGKNNSSYRDFMAAGIILT